MCDRENRELLKYFKNVYCVKTNHSKDQDIRASHKSQTNQRSCLLFSFLTPDWLFSCNTITFQKYFYCSQISWFDCKTLKVYS